MTFKRVSSPKDPVITYATDDGFYKISKRPSCSKWIAKEYSIFNILGTVIGEYDTLEAAIADLN